MELLASGCTESLPHLAQDEGLHGAHVADDDLRERIEVMVAQSAVRRPDPEYMERVHGVHAGTKPVITALFRRRVVEWMLA
jgi:hypothetical protein